MSDDPEIPIWLQASLDQVQARLETYRSESLQLAIEGPAENVDWQQPLRLWTEHDLSCAILRNRLGALCGYAFVPHGHPWWGLDHDHEVPAPHPVDREMTVTQAHDDFGVVPVFMAALAEDGMERFERTLAAQVQVHGGLTWAGPMAIQGAPWGWWLGFDCHHSGDAVDPEHIDAPLARFNQQMIDEFGAHVWTEDEVAGEVGRLALAVHEAKP